MTRAILLFFGLSLPTTTLAIASCSSTECAETATCARPLVASDASDAARVYPDVPPPAGCDPEADARDAPACIDDVYALFVAPTGSDANPGTRAAPLASLAAANDNDRLAGRPRVYLCGDYSEPLRVHPNVSVFGGFTCATWQPSGIATKIAPSGPGFALHVADSAKPVAFSDLEVTAADGLAPGASSIAIFVASSSVVFRRVSASAKRGADGLSPGAPPTNFRPGSNRPGADATNGSPGGQTVCECASGSSVGGAGTTTGNTSAPGSSAPPAITVGRGTTACGNLEKGGRGAVGTSSAAGPIGQLTHEGWIPGAGTAGGVGGPGSGGGGSAGSAAFPGGGGGGCGGCGGAGGLGAGGGGASVALAAFASDVKLETCVLRSDRAGAGGRGGPGEAGAAGALGGERLRCFGGSGGAGASGSGGAGGSAGVAPAVLRIGGTFASDVLSALLPGTSGKEGAGGIRGPAAAEGIDGLDGAPGTKALAKQPIVELE